MESISSWVKDMLPTGESTGRGKLEEAGGGTWDPAGIPARLRNCILAFSTLAWRYTIGGRPDPGLATTGSAL
jgi:hypothetical protein